MNFFRNIIELNKEVRCYKWLKDSIHSEYIGIIKEILDGKITNLTVEELSDHYKDAWAYQHIWSRRTYNLGQIIIYAARYIKRKNI